MARFDFSKPGLQLDQQTSWFCDLHVSYHVGLYGFSLWLVGLTVVVMAAAIGYAFWAGRERPRAYYGLMLLTDGRAGRRLRAPRTCCSSTSSGRRC